MLCSPVVLCRKNHRSPIPKRVVDAFESGLLKFIENVVGSTMQFQEQHPNVLEISFNSTLKFQIYPDRRNRKVPFSSGHEKFSGTRDGAIFDDPGRRPTITIK